MQHVTQWHTASPLWRLALDDSGPKPERFETPELLRFEGDTFMDEVQRTLAGDPDRLAEYVVRPETWRTEPHLRKGWVPKPDFDQQKPPKLYHPAHNRFYLVAASLVCQGVGLPDRTIDAAAEERSGFVMRRLAPAAGFGAVDPDNAHTYDEYAWIGDRQQGRWVRATPEDEVAAGEELLPLSPLSFKQDGRTRRLLAGLVPVASREIYEGGGVSSASAIVEPDANPRLAEFSGGVIAGLRQIQSLADIPNLNSPELDETGREALLFSLVDFAAFLESHLPDVWSEIQTVPAPVSGSDLYEYLRSRSIGGVRWTAMLAEARSIRDQFVNNDNYTIRFSGVVFSYLTIRIGVNSVLAAPPGGQPEIVGAVDDALGDPEQAAWSDLLATWVTPLETLPASLTDTGARDRLLQALLEIGGFLQNELPIVWKAIAAGSAAELAGAYLNLYNRLDQRLLIDVKWRELLANAKQFEGDIRSGNLSKRIAVVARAVTRQQVMTFAAAVRTSGLTGLVNVALDVLQPAPSLPDTPETYYRIRCVYRRPKCPQLRVIKASAPSRIFRLANFFDPDAPAREVRIRMPVDTSHAGLSKFPKNVSVLISNELQRQMSRAQAAGVQGLMDGDVPDAPLPNLGVICSFSIPIISICALILLMIIVQLLNIVFWWMPLFRICLPLNLKK